MRLSSTRLVRPPSSRMPVPIGTSGTTPVFFGLNGAPAWTLKLFQKTSLSVITFASAGGNFSDSSALGTIPMRVVVEAAAGDRHVAHVRGREPDRVAPALDVAHDGADRLGLLRRLADVEARVGVVVGLRVRHLAALGVERVDAVDARLGGHQVRQLVADGVDDEEAVGLVVAGHEAVDRDLVGAVDEEAVLLLVRALEHDPLGLACGRRRSAGSASPCPRSSPAPCRRPCARRSCRPPSPCSPPSGCSGSRTCLFLQTVCVSNGPFGFGAIFPGSLGSG